ncbi:acyltransferase family protein [Halotalea alkalilenta]|uniref:Acyltransferase 3 domain-containing protein n=1 Tax=Halotalea alkalilenta TaxID=376489 RepID=A0A172YEJ5_9GAMM|nr:acyltransferase [Halotalea alkalilenta]ANF57691.1 hypothetical protein A5892_09625 [Halotalea alkalilenta]
MSPDSSLLARMSSPAQRRTKIDTLRGLACLLLVFYHAVDGYTRASLLKEGSLLVSFGDSFTYLRMPLFTFLSGYVYALKPVQTAMLVRFAQGKLRRLGLPLLFVGLPLALLQVYLGSEGEHSLIDALWSPLYPITVLWYLDALLLIFLLVAVLELGGLLRTPLHLGGCLAVALVATLWSGDGSGLLAISGALYLLPFFLLGVWAQRFAVRPSRSTRRVAVASLWLIVPLCGLPVLLLDRDTLLESKTLPWAIGLSAASCLALYFLDWRNMTLARLGAYSYAVFLFHTLFISGSRIVMKQLQLDDYIASEWLLAMSFACGLVGPILLQRLVRHWRLVHMVLLGSAASPRRERGEVSRA